VSGSWFKAEVGSRSFEIDAHGDRILLDGRAVDASVAKVSPNVYSILIDGLSFEVTVSENGATTQVSGINGIVDVELLSRLDLLVRETKKTAGTAKAEDIKAPMPGLVLKVQVREGDAVCAGDGLLVLEAMKMENEIFATGNCVVEHVHVSEGDAVKKGAVLVTMR